MSINEKTEMPSRFNLLWAACLLVVLCLVVFHRVPFQEPANYDEAAWIRAVKDPGLDTLSRILRWDLQWTTGSSSHLGYYAPLPALSIMADLRLGELGGWGGSFLKITNLAVHALNSVLVLVLLTRLGFTLGVALFCAAVFAVHPLQVSTVAWIAERKNLLMTLFFLTAFLSYTKYRESERVPWLCVSLVAYLLSLLSKPSAVALGPCLCLTDWLVIDRRLTLSSVLRVLPFFAAGAVWTLVVTSTEGPVLDAPALLDRVLFASYKVGFLLGKFFFPAHLSHIYPPVTVDSGQLAWWMPSIALMAVVLCSAAIYMVMPIGRLLWGAGFFMVNLIPSLGLVPFTGMRELYVADHYVYLACVGAAIIPALAAQHVIEVSSSKPVRVLAVLLAAGIIGILGQESARHAKIWDNAELLWQDVLRKYPECATAHYNYGHFLDEKERLPEAAAHYYQALAADPRSYQSAHNLGMVFVRMGRADKAIESFQLAVSILPTFGPSHLSLAKLFFFLNRFEEARSACRTARSLGSDCRPEELDTAIREKTGGALPNEAPK